MKVVLCTFLFSLLLSTAFAQEKLFSSYVITNNGDTIYGQVSYHGGDGQYKKCTLQTSKSDSKDYEAGDIKGYMMDGVCYESYALKNVFLKLLVNGSIQLLNDNSDFYVRKDNEKILILTDTKKETVVDGKPYTMNMKEYIGILNMLLYDCPKIKSKINQTELNIKSLSKLIELYNKCMGVSIKTTNSEKPFTSITFGPTISYNLLRIGHLSGNTPVYNETNGLESSLSQMVDVSEFSSTKTFSYGLYCNFSTPRINERLSFTIELLTQRAEFKSSNTYEVTKNLTYYNETDIVINYFKVPIYLEYSFRKQKKRVYPFTYIGTAINVLKYKGDSEIVNTSTVVESGHFYKTYEYNNNLKLNEGLRLSILFGGGVKANLSKNIVMQCMVRYELISGPFQFDYVTLPDGVYHDSILQSLSIGFGGYYRF